MSGQSVVDRLNAAKHSLTGQGLAKSVGKATTEEVTGPKRKHLDYLLQCTHEANVSVPQLADLLIQRTQATNWTVVFKALITVHNVMNYGNERFYQYLASNNCAFHLDNFIDKANPQGYDMSTYIRKYAKYINEKAVAYRVMAFDFCKVKRGKDDGLLRTMAPEKLLKALPVLQTQIDALLEFDPALNELNNGVINAAFLLLFKDLIRLFACYNDGIINLLEKYFDMNRKQCKEALDIYKKFLVRMDKTAEFLKVAEPWSKKQNVGIDKGDIPDLTKAPASLLEALEAHLTSLEGKKASKLQAKAPHSGATQGLTDEEKKKIVADEEKELQRMKTPGEKPKKAKKKKKDKEQKLKAQQAAASMESSSQVPAQTTQVIPPQPAAASASDDLLALDSNPFQAKADNVLSVQASVPNQQAWNNQNLLDPMSLSPAPPQPQQPQMGQFTSETGFATAFGNTQQASPMSGGAMLQPMSSLPLEPISNQQQNNNPSAADLLDLDIGTTVSEGDSTDAPPSEAIVPAENEATILMDPLLQESIQAETAEQQEETAPTNGDLLAPEAEEVTAPISPSTKPKKSTPKEKKTDKKAEKKEKKTSKSAKEDTEKTPDLLGDDKDMMHITIGGQKISIKTKPSEHATPDSVTPSPAVSPMMGERKAPPPGELDSAPDSDEAKEEEENDAGSEEAPPETEEPAAKDGVMDLLADFTTDTSNTDNGAAQPAVGMNSDILDLLGGMAEPVESSPVHAPLKLQGSIDVVNMEQSETQTSIMLLPTSERCITPSPSLMSPDQAAAAIGDTDLGDLMSGGLNGSVNEGVTEQLVDSKPIAVVHAQNLPVKENKPPSSPKPSKPAPVPSNPLEAAMFKQMFPEQPKVVVKKSLAAMQAEGGPGRATVSPMMNRRDSSTENGTAGGMVMQPQNSGAMSTSANSKLLSGDVDTSLASLAGNLSVKPGTLNKGDLQWNAPTEKKLTGGNTFGGIRPTTQTWSQPQQQQPMVQQQPMYNPMQMQPQQQFGYVAHPQQNFMYQQPQPMMYNPHNPGMMGMAPPTYQAQPMMGQQPMGMMQPMGMQPQTTNQQQPLDPFGNL